MCWKLIAIFNLLKIRMRVEIFEIEKCKVTFGLKYILMHANEFLYRDSSIGGVVIINFYI